MSEKRRAAAKAGVGVAMPPLREQGALRRTIFQLDCVSPGSGTPPPFIAPGRRPLGRTRQGLTSLTPDAKHPANHD
jgi:hypothetical protein